MQNPRPPVSPALALGLAVVSASTSSVLIRFAQEQAGSLAIAAYRLGFATLIVLPVLLLRYRAEVSRYTTLQVRLIVLSGIFLALHFATWITSLEFTTVASSVVLVQTTPLLVAVLSPLTLKESITRFLLIGLVVSTIGTVVIGLGDICVGGQCPGLLSGSALKGDALAFAGAVAGAGYVLVGRRVRREISLIPYIGIAYGTAALVLAIWAVGAGQEMTGFSRQTWLWMALLAVFPQLIAHSTYNWALRYLAAATVSLALLGEPVASTLLAYLYLDETPTMLRIFGGMLVLTGIGLATGLAPSIQKRRS
jgi:drug/metabolite transporter (DMT)-like permease